MFICDHIIYIFLPAEIPQKMVFFSPHTVIHELNQKMSVYEPKTTAKVLPVTWPRGYKTFFMLNSVGHEILNAYKDKNIKKCVSFLGSDKPRMLFFPLIVLKMPTIVGILTFVSRKNFMLS